MRAGEAGLVHTPSTAPRHLSTVPGDLSTLGDGSIPSHII